MQCKFLLVMIHAIIGFAGSAVGEPPAKLKAPEKPVVYYTRDPERKEKVQLSDAMAAKLVAVVAGKHREFVRDLLVAPRGTFLVGDKEYSLYGSFITSDPSRGKSWSDPVFSKFWDELNRTNDDLAAVKEFKP